MDSTTLELSRPPEFSPPENGGYGTVSLDGLDWARLLVRLNITDASAWPLGLREGAALLARIREIEADCVAANGDFDWEKLEEAVQDEYDVAIVELERLLDDGKRFSFEAVFGHSPVGSAQR